MKSEDVVDLIVIGGGSAGICASIAAARQGSRVVLIEKSGSLGGMGTLAFVHTFCGLYHPDTSQPAVVVNAGLPAEIPIAFNSLLPTSLHFGFWVIGGLRVVLYHASSFVLFRVPAFSASLSQARVVLV